MNLSEGYKNVGEIKVSAVLARLVPLSWPGGARM
jgi:hypothetical protein